MLEHTEVDSGHGRIETRSCQQMMVDKEWLGKAYRWSGLKSMIKISSTVHYKSTSKDTNGTRRYIASLDLNAEQSLHAERSQCQVKSFIGCWA